MTPKLVKSGVDLFAITLNSPTLSLYLCPSITLTSFVFAADTQRTVQVFTDTRASIY